MQFEAPVVDVKEDEIKMSITLDNSDFQFLQDQLVELKNKNYELTEKNRRGQADFEVAKAKICSLQLKLEEQERDFQVSSTTLRREIEAASITGDKHETKDEDYKIKYKRVLVKAKELQQRYEKSVEVVQQLNQQNKNLSERIQNLEQENIQLSEQLSSAKAENDEKLGEEHLRGELASAISERDALKEELLKANAEMQTVRSNLESQAEERRIHERKGLQVVKELKRQLSQEKSRAETLQKRLEEVLSHPPTPPSSDIEGSKSRLSTSSSTNGNSNESNCNGNRANQDISSVGSWSFVPPKSKSSNVAMNETLSLCSIDSEDRETVQQPCDTGFEDSIQRNPSNISETSKRCKSTTVRDLVQPKQAESPAPSTESNQSIAEPTSSSSNINSNENMLLEEQAVLVDRLTRMQHDKWMLEEKLSYLEQANASLSQDLANKSNVIKCYFLNQAQRSSNSSNYTDPYIGHSSHDYANSRRTSFPNNINHLLSDKPSFKKVVDFLKERSQLPLNTDSDTISKEATKKMQLMLEETLMKCIKLQENLDHVTSELNKLQS